MKIKYSKSLCLFALSLFILIVSANAHAFLGFGSNASQIKPQGDSVVIPLSQITEKASFYSYQGQTKEIRFFVVKSSDGVIRAAFDACDVCYHAGKGYTQKGDNMVCNNCGMRIPTVMVNKVSGGCNPSPLKRTIEGDKLFISVKDLEAGTRYFL